MKGIILAGGAGTRLYPLTTVTSKQLLPVYDKPMIYYPLSTLMLAEIREILIISTPQDISRFQDLLGDGQQFGVALTYAVQPFPDGLAQAFIIGKDFIGDDSCAMILGDNIFYGNGLFDIMDRAKKMSVQGKATIFGYYVKDPEKFGVVEFDGEGRAVTVEEKPINPKSNYAITGLYFYPAGVSKIAEQITPSQRGEYEITSLNDIYLKKGLLNVEVLGRGFAWLDMGTTESLPKAANFISMIEEQQGVMISAPEEIAYRCRWITHSQLVESASKYGKSSYGEHLKSVAEGKIL